MGYLRAGFVILAVFGGIAGAAGPAAAATMAGPAATTSPASALGPGATHTSTPTPTSPPTPTPSALSQTPLLTQQPDGSWLTTIYVNSAALSPAPTFALVTTNPNAAIGGKASTSDPCTKANPDTAPGLTQVCLIFSPGPGQLPVAPVSAAVVMTPAAGGAPVAVTVAVHRIVSAWQYLWIPVICGLALALLLIGGMFAVGLPDPTQPSSNDGHPEKQRGSQLWNRPIYAGSAWSFNGSWATNVTTVATLAAAVLTATGTVGELLPGVEGGRFSLLLALAGAIIAAAPLVFGALNYRFERVDPSSTGASIITLPTGQMVVLSGRLQAWVREYVLRDYHYRGTAVTIAGLNAFLPSEEPALQRAKKGKKRFAVGGAMVTRPDGETESLPRGYRARVIKQDERGCEIAVPGGATITVYGAAAIKAPAAQPPQGPAPAAGQDPQGPAGPSVPDFKMLVPDFVELLSQQDAIVHSGAVLTVPSGGIIRVNAPAPAPPAPPLPCLSMPGTADIVLSARVTVTVDPWVIVDAKDLDQQQPAGDAAGGQLAVHAPGGYVERVARAFWLAVTAGEPAPAHGGPVSYAVHRAWSIELAGNAKISALGAASLGLPAGTVIASPRTRPQGAPTVRRQLPSRTSSLINWTEFTLPHTTEIVASRMGSLLLASFLTLFGAGAVTGILGVLAFDLSTASLLIRSFCVGFLALWALVLLAYSIISFLALADPTPGDALSSPNSSSFML